MKRLAVVMVILMLTLAAPASAIQRTTDCGICLELAMGVHERCLIDARSTGNPGMFEFCESLWQEMFWNCYDDHCRA